MISETPRLDSSVPPDVVFAFSPIHKGALGVAVGLTSGLLLSLVTAFHVVARPAADLPNLLSQYFHGYAVSWPGIAVAFAWGSAAGFAAGWCFAFARNLLLALMVLTIRTRAEIHRTRDFLDHI